MLFNSYVFIFAFLPMTIIGALAVNRWFPAYIKVWIAAASLGFYTWWEPAMVWILLTSVFVNYGLLRLALSRPPGSQARSATVALGVVVNLGFLGWFKYAGFLAFNLNTLFAAGLDIGSVVLPLGISFFTFQKLALLIDVQRGEVEDIRFLDFLVFVTFFPQLIAGPIVLFTEVHDQFRRLGSLVPQWDYIRVGLTIFAMGLAKKILLADNMEHFATPVFNAAAAGKAMTAVEAWVGALSYTFQLYFDFSAYSDMAIGLAWMFGIALPFNFNSPYKATSIIDFWRRWHVTLSRFLKVYLYVPLGGNRYGRGRRHLNLLLVMVLGGLWHGAAWTFVAWGVLHGLYLVLNHLWRDWRGRLAVAPPPSARWAERVAAWTLTFVCVVVAWVLFRADSFAAAWIILKAMFDPAGIAGVFTHAYTFFGSNIVPDANVTPQWLAIAFVICLALPNTLDLIGSRFPLVEGHRHPGKPLLRLHWRDNLAWAAFTGLCLAIGVLGLSRPQVFIYFQF